VLFVPECGGFFFQYQGKKGFDVVLSFVLPTTAADLLFKGAGACFAEGRATSRKEKVVGDVVEFCCCCLRRKKSLEKYQDNPVNPRKK